MTQTRFGPRGLTRDKVVEAAVEMAREVGIYRVTMRSLGLRVGVEAMSLYRHVQGKDDLLLGMVEYLCGTEVAATVAYEPDMSDRLRDLVLAQRYVLIAAAIERAEAS